MSHHARRGCRPELYVVNLVRGLLWHPRPPLTQTAGVVRRTIRRQRALMYARCLLWHLRPSHSRTSNVVRRPVCRQLALMYARGLLWHPRPSHSRTSNVVRRPVCRQLALMYAHTWSIGINPCHTGKLGDCPAQHAIDLVRGLLWYPRPSHSRTSNVVRRPVCRQLALMYAHTWSIGINPCHTGKLGDCPAQHAVDLVRGLLWHPRPPLTQTAGVVRRTVRRQLALMYAHTWSIGINPCHIGNLGDCLAQQAVDLVRGLLWRPRLPLTLTAGIVRRTVRRQRALMYARTLPSTSTSCMMPGFLSLAATSTCHFYPTRFQAHVGCRDCSMSHHAMLADSPALRVVNFMADLRHKSQEYPTTACLIIKSWIWKYAPFSM
ncbi:uncharacterized protein LOC142589858 isoform X3 [Dermacentor variabilis]|uniref:uncharacterized protein LOC142589858 isoform X3 n=1 Tax=Dermacentor variabilis TaxID=34621 RepID=UPI003F5BB98A